MWGRARVAGVGSGSDAGLRDAREGHARRVGLVVGAVVLAFALAIVQKLGLKVLAVSLGGLTVAIVIGWASLREMSLALIAWLVIMSGFRSVGMIFMPGLPDLSLDRVLLVWIIVMFFLRIVVKGERLEGSILPAAILLVNAAYVAIQMQFIGSPSHFHNWVLSMLTPFFGFLYGRYTVRRDVELRNLLLFFFLISLYYAVTSIAEHFRLTALVWPKTILDTDRGLFHTGRSRGPVLHPPMFGQLTAMLMLVWIFFLARVRSFGLKAIMAIGLGAVGLGFLYTFTRGPWVAGAVGVLFLAVMSSAHRRVVVAIVVVMLLFGAVGVLQLANSQFLQERMANTNTIENRLGFLANAVAMMKDHLLFGIGYFRWREMLGEYNHTHYIPFYGMVRRDTSAHVPIHDIYLGRFAEEGLVGSILQWSFYVYLLRVYLRRLRAGVWSRWFDRDTLVLLGGIMVVYMVGGMVIDYRYFDLVNVLFYLCAGIVCGFDPRTAGSGERPAGTVGYAGHRP